MKARQLITNLDKKDLKNLLRYYLENMPKETRPISLKQLVNMKLSSEVQDALKKVYKANTGKELMSVAKTTWLSYKWAETTFFTYNLTLENRNLKNAPIPNNVYLLQMYDKYTIISVDNETEKAYTETLNHKFNLENINKNHMKDITETETTTKQNDKNDDYTQIKI